MLKKAVLFIFLLLLLLMGVVVFNALNTPSKQFASDTVFEPIGISPAAKVHLSEAIQFPTISYDDRSQIDYVAFKKLHQYIQKTYPRIDSFLEKTVINQYTLLYKWTGAQTKLKPGLLMAHMDVVPVDEVDSLHWKNFEGKTYPWKQPPFSGHIDTQYIWGRGALDDKMNVFALLEAVEALLKEDYHPKRTMYFLLGHDEEIGGRDGAAKAAEKFRKEGVEFDFVLDEGLFILSGLMPGIDKAVAYIGVAEKGFVNIQLNVKSSGGHSSRPPKETGIGILSQAIIHLEQNPFPARIQGATNAMLSYLTPEMDFKTRLIFSNRWLLEPLILNTMAANTASNAILRTTIAPTMLQGSSKVNVLPTEAKAIINFRIQPGETTQSVLNHVIKAVDDKRVEVRILDQGFDANDPVEMSDLESESFKTLHQTIKLVYPEVLVAPALMIAGTDSKNFKGLSKNIYRFSPIALDEKELNGFHGINERISIKNFHQAILFYRFLIQG